MDVHRSRFVPYPSSAINALAFSHSDLEYGTKDPKALRLAIGRANGNIELWNPARGAWTQEKVFYGGKNRSVEGLTWTQDPPTRDTQSRLQPGQLRLFSIGYSSSVTEWDLATGLPARHSNGNHSEVWCFAAQPRQHTGKTCAEGATCQKIVAGCADGTVVLLSTEDGDLAFDRFVSRATSTKARALSITYKDIDIVLAGFADSTIRVFDTRNGNVIRNISLGAGPRGGPKEILVWKVQCLSNGNFVSGDSTGEIRIYNGKNYSEQQRVAGHEADILDLAVSRDGMSIFSVGMDRRTCFYSRQKLDKTQGQKRLWRKVSHRRFHDHDVKALTAFEGSKLNVLVAGGIDTRPVALPFNQYESELSRGLPSLPPTPPIVSAPEARLLVSWWNTEVRIWRVKSHDDGQEKPKVVARLALQGEENISSLSISRNGDLLAVATASSVKLLQLLRPQPATGAGLRIRKVEMPTFDGATVVRLAADGKWLAVINAQNEVHLARIVRSDDPVEAPRVLDKTISLRRIDRTGIPNSSLDSTSGLYGRSITHAAFSTDGNIFAVADLNGYVDTWVVEGHEDPTALEVDIDDTALTESEEDESGDEEEKEAISYFGQRWIQNPAGHLLPRLDHSPVLLSFEPTLVSGMQRLPNGNPAVHPTRHNPHPHSHDLPTATYQLLLVTSENRVHLFDVLAGRLSDWSRRNPPSSFAPEYKVLNSAAKGCVWDVSTEQTRLWLYGESWLFMFDLNKDLQPYTGESSGSSKKRKREYSKDALKKINSGAGSTVPAKDSTITKMRRFSGTGKNGEAGWVDVRTRQINNDSDEDIDMDVQPSAHQQDHTQEEEDAVNGIPNGDSTVFEHNGAVQPIHAGSGWHTFKYRPILGVVPVSVQDEALEVVLVERPLWELELPPRFVGVHES